MFSNQRITWALTRRVLLALVVLALAYLAVAPTGRYLVRAAWAEGRAMSLEQAIAYALSAGD